MITNRFTAFLEYKPTTHNKKLGEGDWLCVLRPRHRRGVLQVTAFWCRFVKNRDVSVSPKALFTYTKEAGWQQPSNLKYGVLAICFDRDSVFRWMPGTGGSSRVPDLQESTLEMLFFRAQRELVHPASKG